jgi:hypothetical protein
VITNKQAAQYPTAILRDPSAALDAALPNSQKADLATQLLDGMSEPQRAALFSASMRDELTDIDATLALARSVAADQSITTRGVLGQRTPGDQALTSDQRNALAPMLTALKNAGVLPALGSVVPNLPSSASGDVLPALPSWGGKESPQATSGSVVLKVPELNDLQQQTPVRTQASVVGAPVELTAPAANSDPLGRRLSRLLQRLDSSAAVPTSAAQQRFVRGADQPMLWNPEISPQDGLQPALVSPAFVRESGLPLFDQGDKALATGAPVAAAMVLAERGQDFDLSTLMTQSGADRGMGVSLDRTAALLRQRGVQAAHVEDSVGIARLADLTRRNPVIAELNLPLEHGGLHAVVIDEVREARVGSETILMAGVRDPYGGREYYVAADELAEAMTGDAVVLENDPRFTSFDPSTYWPNH